MHPNIAGYSRDTVSYHVMVMASGKLIEADVEISVEVPIHLEGEATKVINAQGTVDQVASRLIIATHHECDVSSGGERNRVRGITIERALG